MFWARILSFSALFFVLSVACPTAYAATLYIDPNSIQMLKGDTATAKIRIDTDDGECINSVSAELSYSEGVQAVDVSTGRSILTLWVENPKIDSGGRKVTLAGGIPNGYCGRIPGDPNLTNVIAEIVFRAPGFTVGGQDTQQALLHFEPGTQVLLNDGAGTPASLRLLDGTIELLQQVGTTTTDVWREAIEDDNTPPQPFSIELAQEPNAFSGKYFIAFNTTDKQSGMDHYEVLEDSRDDLFSFNFARTDAPWSEVTSPYVLEDQALKSIIRVRALDKAGNERIATLIADESMRPTDILLIAIIAGAGALAALILIGVGWFFWRRRKPKQNDNHDIIM